MELSLEPVGDVDIDALDAATGVAALVAPSVVGVHRHRCVSASAQRWDDFERVCTPSTAGGRSMAVSEILAMVTSDTLQHVGQIAYLRGILRDQGWYAKRRSLA